MNNNNSFNHLPEQKGHLRKLSAEGLEAINARVSVRWKAQADMAKAVELSYPGSLTAMRQAQPEVIQNVAGVAMAANESPYKADAYSEVQPAVAPQPEAPAPVAPAANPLLADAYDALNKAYTQQEVGQ